MILLAAATAGLAGSYLPFRIDEPLVPRPRDLAGAFDGPPVSDWSVALPATLNAATHTERARPVIVGDEVLVGAAGGRGLYRFARRNGDSLGVFAATGAVESEPLVHEGLVIFGDTSGSVWCYDLGGTLRWSVPVGGPVVARPAVAEGRVLVSTLDELAVALEIGDGSVAWRYRERSSGRRAELALYGRPSPTVVDDTVIFGFSDGAVVALALADGRVMWDRAVGEGTYPDVLAPAKAVGGDVFASGYFRPLVAIDRVTHNVRWRVDAGAADELAIADVEGATWLFHPGTDGILRAVVALTGDEVWRWDSGTGGALTAPTATPAGLLVGSSDGGVYLVDPRTGRQLWAYDPGYQLVGVSASPFVEGRQAVFTTNAGRLVSVVVPRRLGGRAARKLGDDPLAR
jgi:outer membrane protein assembly factor BamB